MPALVHLKSKVWSHDKNKLLYIAYGIHYFIINKMTHNDDIEPPQFILFVTMVTFLGLIIIMLIHILYHT